MTLSSIGRIKQALDLAKLSETGCALTYFDVLELRGYVRDLEAEVANWKREYDYQQQRACDAEAQLADKQAIIDEQKKEIEELKREYQLAYGDCERYVRSDIQHLAERNEARRVAEKFYKELQWHKDIQKQNMENLKAIAENCSE